MYTQNIIPTLQKDTHIYGYGRLNAWSSPQIKYTLKETEKKQRENKNSDLMINKGFYMNIAQLLNNLNCF